LIDGPSASGIPALPGGRIRALRDAPDAPAAAVNHGTFIASLLGADRGGQVSGLCPGCTLLAYPLWAEGDRVAASPARLAEAIVACVEAGANILNMSLGFAAPSFQPNLLLSDALRFAAARHVLVFVAAGNSAVPGGTPLTRDAHVIPVVACDRSGTPMGGL